MILEFFNDSDDSKIYIIEVKKNKLIIQYGKKDSKLKIIEKEFDSNSSANTEYKNLISQKLKKGYVKINNSKVAKKSEKKSNKSNKSDKSDKKIETVSQFVMYLINTSFELDNFKNNKIKYRFIELFPTYEEFMSFYKNIDGMHQIYKTVFPKLTKTEYDNKVKKKEFFNFAGKEKYFKDPDFKWNDVVFYELFMAQFYKYLILPKIEKKLNTEQNHKIKPFFHSAVIHKSITASQQSQIMKNIKDFANTISIDYHPGTDDKVRDIVHPSLYPYITLNTKTTEKPQIDFWGRHYEDSKYQWLPSEFVIDKNGKCKIDSYINNLPVKNKDLYGDIANMFETVLPYFENIWSYIKCQRVLGESEIPYTEIKKYKNTPKGDYIQLSLKNRTLQVITKIVEITLEAGKELEGAWHVEGMSHENIFATADIILEQDKDFLTELYLKRGYTGDEMNKLLYGVPQNPLSQFEDLLETTQVPLGKINTKQFDIIVFPNSHIHKIDMKNVGSSVQKRTILVFWLINPDVKVISSKNILQQKYDIKKAKEVRLDLMKERSFHKQSFNKRKLNLCEH